ncbi:MAG: hypothetical protein ACO2ZZ_14460 [Cyclobacteriaceae bacterium]
MKNERLLIVTVCLALGSGCLAFGLEAEKIQTVDITDQIEVLETVKTVKTVKTGNPVQGEGLVLEVNENMVIFIDTQSGEIHFKHVNGLTGEIAPGDLITYIYITTPNGNEIIKQIKKKVH